MDDFDNDTVDDEANAQVTAGEQLTERQVLDGLLVHSANNYADTAGPLGRREHAGLRGQDERTRRPPRDGPHPLRRSQRLRSPARSRPPATS